MAPMKGRADEDFAAEIEAHIQLETDRLVEDGMEPHEARLGAERRFGNVVRVRERFYESRRWMWLDNLTQDIRGAVRSVARYPVAFAIAVISLGAGIGAATSTLVVRDAVFLAPPPLYAEPEAMSSIGVSTPQRRRAQAPAGLYRQWLQDEQLATGLAAGHSPALRDVRVEERVDSAGVRAVTAELFSRLGVAPVLGMGFDEWPAQSEAPVILSHAAWHRLVGGRTDVVGLPLWIDGQPHTIIGVMPERFWFAAMNGPVWTRLDVATLGADAPLDVVMRRPAELTPEAMAERLRSGADSYAARQPVDSRDFRVRVDPMAGTPLGRQVGPMVILLLSSAVVLTLLIACTNVAVLMMAQWTTREHEIAIRSSLGGARGRLVRALLTESMLVALSGGLLGVCLTLALRGVLVRNSAFARFFDFSIDPWVWAQCALTTIGAGILTGIAPALYETRRLGANPLQAIRGSDGARQRWRHGLVIFEIATTVALLVVTAAMLGSYRRTVNGDPGFDTHPLLNLRVESPAVPIERILEQVRGTPGVIDAEAATVVPYFAAGPQQAVARDAAYGRVLNAERVAAGPRYFATLGVALTAGRAFTDRDVAGAPPVAVVNEVLAAAVWPGASPVGRVAWVDGTPHEIVGVVEGYAHHALRQPRPTIILPLAQEPHQPTTRLQILVRTRISLAADTDWLGTPSPFVQSLRRNVSALGTGPLRVTTMDQIIAITSQEILVGTYPLAPLILTALLLTAAGIYGVLAFAVTRRATELAVRVAVGATRADVLRLVMRHSVRLLGIGMACGVGATFALTRVAQGRGGMFDSPGWQTFAIPMLVIVVIAVLATWIPLRRALQIDPARLLRTT